MKNLTNKELVINQIDEEEFFCEKCGSRFKRYPALQLQFAYDKAIARVSELEKEVANQIQIQNALVIANKEGQRAIKKLERIKDAREYKWSSLDAIDDILAEEADNE